MSIICVALPENLSLLESDFAKLNEELPCDSNLDFREVSTLNNPDQIAVTTYGEELTGIVLPPYIEFSTYFQLEDLDRKIIFLHEIIHACQRQNDLLGINQKTREILKTYVEYIVTEWKKAKEKTPNPITIPFEILDQKKDSIRSLFEIPFELSDDVFFKEKYPHLFEKNMTMNYNNISGYSTKLNSFSTIFQKYHLIYKELLRTGYLSQLNIDTELGKNFKKLYDNWHLLYEKQFTQSERSTLDLLIEPLTDLNNCQPSKISPKLEELSQFVWNNSETL